MSDRQTKLIQLARNNTFRAEIIKKGYNDVNTISKRMRVDLSTAEHHLTILQRCGLVNAKNQTQ